ncbi:MAG: clostripain-related cysteine peptidase [Bacteroidales bacterium]
MTKLYLKKHLYYILICSITLLASCSKEDDIIIPNALSNRTILIYIPGDDNVLSPYAEYNLTDIVQAVSNNINWGTILCYFDNYRTNPTLYKIDKLSPDGKKILKQYTERNSATVESLSQVIDDMQTLAPSKEYGLVLWGHGSGWDPKSQATRVVLNSYQTQSGPSLYAYGGSSDGWMDLDEIKQAIPDNLFHFILFDACYMSQIEVAYSLRNKAKYMIASAAETMATGFPYRKIVPIMLAQNLDLEKLCQTYYEYYNNKAGAERTATVALIDLEVIPAFATWCKNIYASRSENLANLSPARLQYFDRSRLVMMFDLEQVLKSVAPDKVAESITWFNKLVKYKAHTPYILNQILVSTDNYSGVTTYVPFNNPSYQSKNDQYTTTEWYQQVVNP